MKKQNDKEKLIQMIERRVWNPILRAQPEDYPKSERKRLEQVQRKTQQQKDRYHGYENAGQVRQEFQDDLSSKYAAKVNRDLDRLDLPTQPQIADRFFDLADRLGVKAEQKTRRHHKPHPPHPWHKSKPESRKKARRVLKKEAEKGNRRALETMRKAPAGWARRYARKLTGSQ